MSAVHCPICGDPNPFRFWIDAVPPLTCPDDPAWPARSLHGICPRQLRRAEQAAERRKLTPDAFDKNGTLIPSEAGRMWENWFAANPNREIAT